MILKYVYVVSKYTFHIAQHCMHDISALTCLLHTSLCCCVRVQPPAIIFLRMPILHHARVYQSFINEFDHASAFAHQINPR